MCYETGTESDEAFSNLVSESILYSTRQTFLT